jgi:hypothetical protein
MIDPQELEGILDETVRRLGEDVRASTKYHDPRAFQDRVFEVLRDLVAGRGININAPFHVHAFPDILANGFGIEVKTTTKDSWTSVGNSVFEGMRDESVKKIYVVFAKLGGMPGVRWGRYEERITHVRISHAPRFVLEMDRDASLFEHMDVTYEEFARLPSREKMRYVRKYSRERLRPGESLWWLEDEEEDTAVPVPIQIYMALPERDKVKLRAECALLFPQIVGSGRDKRKYADVALYLLGEHNVIAPQTRDLFSAGSVAGEERGGIYIRKAFLNPKKKIQEAMIEAASRLDDSLFVRYWGESVPPEKRIARWLNKVDKLAKDWKPSDDLFLDVPREPESDTDLFTDLENE